MKKTFYISLFIFLGILVQFVVHGVVEMVYINLLMYKFEIFSLGFSFDTWFTIHSVFSVVLFAVGVVIGCWRGVYWWERLYENKAK